MMPTFQYYNPYRRPNFYNYRPYGRNYAPNYASNTLNRPTLNYHTNYTNNYVSNSRVNNTNNSNDIDSYKNNANSSSNNKINDDINNTVNHGENRFKAQSDDNVWLDLFGLKLYFDDVLILSLLFFLYKEEVKDEGLFLALVLLLIS